MQYRFTFLCLFLLSSLPGFAQYISRSEPVPYACPVVCPGSTLTLKIPQIQNLPVGTQIQAQLSNVSGTFTGGTQVLPVTSWSTNAGSNWNAGVFTFSANINDLYIRVVIPIGTAAGSAYTLKIQTSTGYVSNDLFQCSSSNTITVTANTTPLPAVAQTAQGTAQWIGHIYSWTPTTAATLTTPALINAQSFFSAANYQGHVLYTPLSIDVPFSSTGGVPGTVNNGTSIDCGNSLSTNFSMRMLRQENFTPGYYTFTIQGDDGIRFSLDGGVSWILDAFIEQQYATSFRSTAAAFPNGICLSGPTDLVIEYFQRPADSRLTFTSVQVSTGTFSQPLDQTVCANGTVGFGAGTAITGSTYQWQVSSDGGATFSNLANGGVYTGVTTVSLNLSSIPASLDGTLYQCVISSPCGTALTTNSAVLTVEASPQITQQPSDQTWCSGQTLVISGTASGSGLTYQWQLSTNGGTTFSNISNNATYSGTATSTLTITGSTVTYVGYVYQLLITGCGTTVTSIPAEIISGGSISISQQPQPLTVCQGDAATMSITASGGTSYQWQVDGGSGFINVNDNNGYSGSQTVTLSLIGAATSVNGLVYQCVISGGCSGNVISASAVLTVNPNTGITQQAQNQTICAGQNTTFTIAAGGSGLTYQWQISTDGGTTYTNLSNTPPFSGVTTTSLLLTNPSSTFDSNLFRCLVSGTCGSTQTSNFRTLTITSLPVVQTQPLDQSACVGTTIVFSATISGNPAMQWQVSTDGGTTFSNVNNSGTYSGATTSQLTISSVDFSMNSSVYQLTASACGTTVTSNPAILEVVPLPTVQITNVPPPVCPGEDVTLTVSVQNAVSIRWQMNTTGTWTDLLNSATFSGSDQPVLTISAVPSVLQNALFRCVVTGACLPDAISEDVLLYLNGIPVLTSQPVSQVACSGGTVSFPLGVLGDGISYEWQLKQEDGSYAAIEPGGFYSGVNTATLLVEGVNEVDGVTIRCLLEGCGDAILSDTFNITIYQNDPVYIPSAFSPDGDPNNERFQVFTVGEPKLDATIFNRWGEQVYHWTAKEDGWDGTYNGALVQEGIFMYRIVVTTACERRTTQGSITVFR